MIVIDGKTDNSRLETVFPFREQRENKTSMVSPNFSNYFLFYILNSKEK